jgi:hypothetical protein
MIYEIMAYLFVAIGALTMGVTAGWICGFVHGWHWSQKDNSPRKSSSTKEIDYGNRQKSTS